MGGQIVEVIASNFSLFKMAKKKILHSVFFQFDLPIVQPFTIQTKIKRIQIFRTSGIKQACENIIHDIWICKSNISSTSKPFTQNWLFLFVVKPISCEAWPFLTISHFLFLPFLLLSCISKKFGPFFFVVG